VGGDVAAVQAALDALGVERRRDGRTGDIVHPSLAYLVQSDGTIAYASSGAQAQLVDLGGRLGWGDRTR
jgi:cytochrome oxidase Cu insertion factor (SCO1/SenC/PrrC family)